MAQANLLSYFKPRPPVIESTLLRSEYNDDSSEQILAATSISLLSSQLLPTSEQVSNDGALERKDWSKSKSAAPFRPLDRRARILKVESAHLNALKTLTSSTLPVRYPDKFYNETVTNEQVSEISRAVLFDEKLVGWIRCRLEPSSHQTASSTTNQIYIQALCLLAPYRGFGLANHLLNAVLESDTLTENNATFVYAHVWENNDVAMTWYENRGFSRPILIDQYYRKLRPSGAWIFRKELG